MRAILRYVRDIDVHDMERIGWKVTAYYAERGPYHVYIMRLNDGEPDTQCGRYHPCQAASGH